MRTPFLPEHNYQWSKIVIPYNSLPEVMMLPAEYDLETLIAKQGNTAVYFPDQDFGMALSADATLTRWSGSRIMHSPDLDDIIVLHTVLLVMACENVERIKIIPTYRNKIPLAPLAGNAFHLVTYGEVFPKTNAGIKQFCASYHQKRLHSVRAHIRHLSSGKLTLVRQHIRGRDSKVDKVIQTI